MKFEEVDFAVPDGHQLVLGQSHFIKTVEDLYEALVTSMPEIKFGVAFCEASGKSLIRSEGSDPDCTRLAVEAAERIAAGHIFAIVLSGSFPINVLNRVKQVEEVAQVFCATSNSVTVLVGDSGKGRGVMGVIDGGYPKGQEADQDRADRHDLLRKLGYKK